MQKITPHLWFDKEAKEAAEFYTSLLPHSKVTNITSMAFFEHLSSYRPRKEPEKSAAAWF